MENTATIAAPIEDVTEALGNEHPLGADGVEIITLGCRLNAYESEAMRRHAQAARLEHRLRR